MSTDFVHEIIVYHIVFLFFVERELKCKHIDYVKKVNNDNSVSLFFKKKDSQISRETIYYVKSLYDKCF